MKRSRSGIVALVGVALLALGAGWWLLHERPRETESVAALRMPTTPAPADQALPTFHAPPGAAPAVAPIALDAPRDSRDGTEVDAGIEAVPRDAPLDLTVVHADGAPASGAVVSLVMSGQLLDRRVTDGAGRAHFNGCEGSARLGIGGVCDVPLVMELASAVGTQRVVLREGLVVAGRVLVDGAPPTRPLLLGLWATEGRGSVRESPEDSGLLFSSLDAELPGVFLGRLDNAQVVGTDGRFEFSGLPQGWEGHFDVTLEHNSRDSETALAVAAPARDMLLQLTSTRTIRGRVVDIGGAVAVP
jgi:hypothetical protein